MSRRGCRILVAMLLLYGGKQIKGLLLYGGKQIKGLLRR
jgi:hypothetical protein